MRVNPTDQGAAARPAPAPAGAHSPPVGGVVALVHRGRGETDHIVSCPHDRPGLWNPASGRFDTVRLRAAIVSRGWTVAEFAATAGVSRACLYNVLRAWSASDRTAIRIAATLATREPISLLVTE